MRLKTVVAVVLACLFVTSAEARSRLHPDCGVTMPCTPMAGQVMPSSNPFAGIKSIKVTMRRDSSRKANKRRHKPAVSHSLANTSGWQSTAQSYVAGIVAPLAAKVSEIQASCGSKVVSGVRHTHIAGTRRMSLHASGKAVDLAGNPSCIYAMLHGWPGGYSIDYSRVRHVHLSYDPGGGREMGVRFRHGGHRYARRHHHRYASAR